MRESEYQQPKNKIDQFLEKKDPKRSQKKSFNKEDIKKKVSSQKYMNYAMEQMAAQICHYV